MAEIEISDFDSKGVKELLYQFRRNTDAVRKRMKSYANLITLNVFQDIMDHFKKEMGPDGKWPMWSVSYAGAIQGRWAFRTLKSGRVWKMDPYDMEFYGIKPPRKPGLMLQVTGRLRNSFTPQKYRTNAEGISWFNPAKTKGGFPYAAAHNIGGPQLPKREFMWLSEDGMEQIELQTLWFIMENEAE